MNPGAGPEDHLTHSVQAEVSFQPEKGEVSVSGLEQVGRHQHAHVHVHRDELGETERKCETAWSSQVDPAWTAWGGLTALAPDMW